MQKIINKYTQEYFGNHTFVLFITQFEWKNFNFGHTIRMIILEKLEYVNDLKFCTQVNGLVCHLHQIFKK
jgi:hypothetical protein